MTTDQLEAIDSLTYDVFLSYRAEDTPNFTYNLYNNLVQDGIRPWLYRRGDEDRSLAVLLKAVQDSRTSVIIFSETYATSHWCLNELVKILHCCESRQHMALPIYYKVDRSDVLNSFNEALAKGTFKDYIEKVEGWRAALTVATNLSAEYYFLQDNEAQLVDNIVEAQLVDNVVEEISAQVFHRNL